MKKMLISFILTASSLFAGDFVAYEQSTGKIIGYDKQYEIKKRDLTPDGNGFYFMGPNVLGLLYTTNAPAGLTNIVQLTDKKVINPADQAADYTQGQGATEIPLKVILTALVKVINLRLPAGNKITAAELKEAIKEEL